MTTHVGTQARVAKIEVQEEVYASRSMLQQAVGRIRRDKLTLVAMAVLLLLAGIAVFAPVITSKILHIDPNRTDLLNTFLKPGEQGHILGTDEIGRDHLARLMFAGQMSLGIAFLAGNIALAIGVSIGIITGYYGGIVDDIVNWFITTLNSIPYLFVLLIISAVLSPGPLVLIVILGFLGWTGTTRLVRGQTLALREREFIVGARAMGASHWRIMFVHILPNLVSIIVVNLAIDIGVLILVESALSFLGVGIQPPTASWGNMLTKSQDYYTRAPHLIVLPGLLILITVLCMYVIGDGVRDAFDPTLKE